MTFYFRREYRGPLRLAVLDLAGTIVDYGSRAPSLAYVELFKSHGVEITLDQARAPMGLDKDGHLRAILAMPEVAVKWWQVHGREATEEDVAQLAEEGRPLVIDMACRRAKLIPGALHTCRWLRERGVRIAATTGYFRELHDALMPILRRQGFQAAVSLCADDVAAARPAPWMLIRCMVETGVYPPASVVKIGDTTPDVDEGLNAGAWTVAVVRSGAALGMSEEEIQELPPAELAARLDEARAAMLTAGAHIVVESIADVPQAVQELEMRMTMGDKP